MTKSGVVSVPLVEEALDLESTATDAVRFVPVDLRDPDAGVLEPDVRDAFEFSPAALAIFLLQPNDLSDATTGSDDFNRLDRADDLEVHVISSYARCQERDNTFSRASSGCDGDSADVWARQNQFRLDGSVGVPPDASA